MNSPSILLPDETIEERDQREAEKARSWPLVNGQPAICAEAVQQWFVKARLLAPSTENILSIVKALNHLQLHKAFWIDEPDACKWRSDNKDVRAQKRIAKAVKTICDDLPEQIRKSKNLDPKGYDTLESFLELAQIWIPNVDYLLKTKKGRKTKEWHIVARSLRKLLTAAMATAGGVKGGFASPAGKGIQILKDAFEHLGVEKTNEQIVDALRPHRSRDRSAGKTTKRFPIIVRSV